MLDDIIDRPSQVADEMLDLLANPQTTLAERRQLRKMLGRRLHQESGTITPAAPTWQPAQARPYHQRRRMALKADRYTKTHPDGTREVFDGLQIGIEDESWN